MAARRRRRTRVKEAGQRIFAGINAKSTGKKAVSLLIVKNLLDRTGVSAMLGPYRTPGTLILTGIAQNATIGGGAAFQEVGFATGLEQLIEQFSQGGLSRLLGGAPAANGSRNGGLVNPAAF